MGDKVDKRTKSKLNRRSFLVAAGTTALAAPFIKPSWANERVITVRDPGGPYGPALKAAFYDPFYEETGIKAVGLQASHSPTGQIKAMVDAKNYVWDGADLSKSDVDLLANSGYVEPVAGKGGLGKYASQIPETLRSEFVVGVGTYATVMAYRTDAMGKNPPKNWMDFWNVKDFPGERSIRKHPIDTLEAALMADGVPKENLYPLDVDRAFKSLDKIKEQITIWWTGGAQTSQLLKTGEVDCLPTWNGRAQVAIDDGAPVKLVWDGAIYSYVGWAILKGGPNVDLMREFIEFCSNGERQAVVTKYAADGPANPNAYDHIDPARAEVLPSNPKFLPKMVASDTAWWGKNKEPVQEKFETWLLA